MWFDDPLGDGRPPILFPKVRCGGRHVAWVRQFLSKELRGTAQRSLGSQPIDLGTVAPLTRERMEPQERAQAQALFSQKVGTNTVSAVREIEEAVARLRGAAENLKAMATSSNANPGARRGPCRRRPESGVRQRRTGVPGGSGCGRAE